MASSQIEVVASSPFGSVLRDRNRRDRRRESNVRAAQAAFEKNLKDLVRDHLNTCISISDQNSENQNACIDSWIANGHRNTNRRNSHNRNRSTQRDAHVGQSQSQCRIIDRLAARQAREIVSTTEKQAQEAEILLSSNTTAALTSTPPHSNASSPTRSETSRASSLVQIWEARLNRTVSGGNPMNLNQCQTSRTSSGLSSLGNSPPHPVMEPSPPHPVMEPSQDSELYESTDERMDIQSNNEDSFPDWESQSDRTVLSEAPSLINGERERVRVADIIKRLINGSEDGIVQEQGNNVSDQSPPRKRRHIRIPEKAEQGGFVQVLCSPRLRGRQAFHDFLMHMERERQKELESLAERQAVSKFPQRGRIQSMLRLRCLQRGLAIPLSSGAEENRNRPKSAGAEAKELPQGSTIMQLREKFNTSKEHVMTAPSHVASARHYRLEMANSTLRSDIPSTSNPPSEEGQPSTLPRKPPVAPLPEKSHHDGDQTTLPKRHTVPPSNEESYPKKMSSTRHQIKLPEFPEKHSVENKKECVVVQRKPHLHVAFQTTSLEATNLDSQKTTEASTSLNGQEENQIAREQDAPSQQHLNLVSQPTVERETVASSDGLVWNNEMAEERDADDQQHPYIDSEEIVETTTSFNDWDENEMAEDEEDYYQQYLVQANYNWFSDIARPRSYWENRRQAWYQEVLNTTSEDEEIRQLLERRRVSTFLSSDFRDKMDRLVLSRVEMQAKQEESQEDEPDGEERLHQVMSYLRRHLHDSGSQGGEERDEVEEEEDEEEDEDQDEEEEEEQEQEGGSIISHQSHEATEYRDQSSPSILPPPSLLMSWGYQDDNETGNDSDRVPSRSSPGRPPSQAQSFQGSQLSSSNRPSLEMELICDLRGHMELLHREMAELRKSILSCMDMQMKLQQSFNPEVKSVRGQGKNLPNRALLKRTCCICYEVQVDSLLYRCGHMCTCLKCAQELQWSSGKCPICRAPIVDVVRAYVES
ncbi:hypothetical protein SLE2022_254900 [Rubroshorea leprosula]